MGGTVRVQPGKNRSLRSPVDDDLRTWHDDLKEFCVANALKTSTLPTIIFGGYPSDSDDSDGDFGGITGGDEDEDEDEDSASDFVTEITGEIAGGSNRKTEDKGFLMTLKENNVRFQLDEADPQPFYSSAMGVHPSPARHYLHSWHGLLKASPQPESNTILPYLQENDSPNLQLSTQYNPFTNAFGGAVVDTLESADCGCEESIEASIVDMVGESNGESNGDSDSESKSDGDSNGDGESDGNSDSESNGESNSDGESIDVTATLSALIVNK